MFFYDQCVLVFRRSGLYLNELFGAGSGPVWKEMIVHCTGHESSLVDCRRLKRLPFCTSRGPAASVACTPGIHQLTLDSAPAILW